jgi:hypothetical protein
MYVPPLTDVDLFGLVGLALIVCIWWLARQRR